ncbi:MAG: DUF2829 domain-containing protein [Lactobacillales bacterium]|jgi:hypothetical protein|nr:DUF2829 domain-containing protein [Lactobacillales bacterium]
MVFEEALSLLKSGRRVVRKSWSGEEQYVQLFNLLAAGEEYLPVTPCFLIYVLGEEEGYSMWSPTTCDILADDWVEVNV